MELQERVHEEVELSKRRSGWSAEKTLKCLGVSRTTYYRWRRTALRVVEGLCGPSPQRMAQPYEALPEEKSAVKEYALKHAEYRHRELSWRMVDEDVAYVSPSTTYRILRESKLVCPWSRRNKRRREAEEKARRPNQIWATDIKYVFVGGRHYFLVCFLDEYSRYIVHHELLWSMTAGEVSVAAQAALETLPKDDEGRLMEHPEIRSDNGSCYISREFGGVLDEYGLTHRRIKPHCPEENGLMERANRTLGEALEEEELTDYLQAVKVIGRTVRWYNEQRLHSALGFLRPVDYYRGRPEELYEERRQKLVAARHRRKEKNLQLRQPRLPLTNEEPVSLL